MTDDDGSSKVGDKIDELKRKAAVAAARKTLQKTGHELLDGVERWLFGKVGGAEEVLQEEAGRGGGLDRLRDEAEGDEADEPTTAERRRAAREARRAAAIEELEAIKRRLHEGEDEPGEGPGETSPDDDEPEAPDPPPLRRGKKTKRRL